MSHAGYLSSEKTFHIFLFRYLCWQLHILIPLRNENKYYGRGRIIRKITNVRIKQSWFSIYVQIDINNSTNFINKTKFLDFSRGRMVSFDVNSSFIKVPADDVMPFINSTYNTDQGMQHDSFLEPIKLCVSCKSFPSAQNCSYNTLGWEWAPPILSSRYIEYFETGLLLNISPLIILHGISILIMYFTFGPCLKIKISKTFCVNWMPFLPL